MIHFNLKASLKYADLNHRPIWQISTSRIWSTHILF